MPCLSFRNARHAFTGVTFRVNTTLSMHKWFVNAFHWLLTGLIIAFIYLSVRAWEWCGQLSSPSISSIAKTEPAGASGLGHFQNHVPFTTDNFPSLKDLKKETKGSGFNTRASVEEFEAARKQFHDGKVHEALIAMESLARGHDAPSLMVAVARAHALAGNKVKATELLTGDIAKRMNPGDLGLAYMEVGDLQNASTYLEKALSSPSANWVAFVNLSTVYWSSGQNDRARAIAERGIKRFPKTAALYYALGQTYLGEALDQNKPDENDRRKLIVKALSAYKTAMNFSLDSPLERVCVINNVGLAVRHLGLDSTSARYWAFAAELAAKHDIKHAPLFLNLGNQMLNSGDLDGGLAQFKAAIEADRQYLEAYLTAGQVCLRLERFSEATDFLQRANAIRPGVANSLLILCALHTQSYQEAHQFATTIPSSEQAAAEQLIAQWQTLANDTSRGGRIQFASLMLEVGAPRAALTVLGTLAEPDAVDVAIRLGQAHEALQDFSLATTHYRQVLVKEPLSLRAGLGLANCMLSSKDPNPNGALQILDAILSKSSNNDFEYSGVELCTAGFALAMELSSTQRKTNVLNRLISTYRSLPTALQNAELLSHYEQALLKEKQ
jgi:tetratricopeptide (TPR) repeat protein